MARFDQVPIRNFSRVSGTVFRGAEPGLAGVDFVRSLGVRTVIDLRKAGFGTETEQEWAQHRGLEYFNLDLGYLSIPEHVTAAMLAILLHPSYQPVFLHCNDGLDRTGAMVAILRIAVEGWPLNWAVSELLAKGFHPWQWFLKNAVTRFGEDMAALDSNQRLWAVQELVDSNLFPVQ
jgi:tyrosine-protein phosphatase SIW14